MIAATHVACVIALARLLDLRTGTAMIGSALPDLDHALLFAGPLVPNGAGHSLLAGFLAGLVAFPVSGSRKTAESLSGSYLLHLALDLLCLRGIMLLFPIERFYSLAVVPENSLMANSAVLSLSVIALAFESGSSGGRVRSVFS